MIWPRDDAKLERVRSLMDEHELEVLVVRAPDNVFYLTNYLCMKGYDICVFPRDGDPTLIVIEPQESEAERTAWTGDVRLFKSYDEADPRPPTARSLDLATSVVRASGYERIGLELSQGTQTADLMVGEPTVFTQSWFEAFPGALDASPLLARGRSIKTAQEIERMRLANEIAGLAMEHVAERIRPGMTEAAVAALWEGHVHAIGTGYAGKVEHARGYSLVWSGPGIRTFTATSNRPVQGDEPTLFEIWVCADGYWCDHTKNLCPGDPRIEYVELLELLLGVFDEARATASAGESLADLDRLIRTRIAEGGYGGQPSHPVCHGVGARAHEPPWAHQAGTGTIEEGMVLAIEPGIYWEGGGGLRLEDNFLVTVDGNEKLSSFPDDFREVVCGGA
jgi:Xaa-Pro aminopeptidase